MKSLIIFAVLVLLSFTSKAQKENQRVILYSDTFFKGDTVYYFYFSESDHKLRRQSRLDLTFVNGKEYTRMSSMPISLYRFYNLQLVFKWQKGKNTFKITLLPAESINNQITISKRRYDKVIAANY